MSECEECGESIAEGHKHQHATDDEERLAKARDTMARGLEFFATSLNNLVLRVAGIETQLDRVRTALDVVEPLRRDNTMLLAQLREAREERDDLALRVARRAKRKAARR